MFNLYPQLVQFPIKNSIPIAAESKKNYLIITERHLQALWWEQIYLKQLVTCCGKKVEVLSPGQWNSSFGPDFRKAHLLIDGIEYKGDVEIHLSDAGWEEHGHHTNPQYDNTVLHLSFWKSPVKSIKTSQGKEIPRLYLEDALTIPHQNIAHQIDIDLYPYKPALGAGKCSTEIFCTMEKEDLEHFFAGASFWRLVQKAELILQLDASPEGAFIAAFARCLGFPNNSTAFLQLYLSLSKLPGKYTIEEYQAFGLGACGYFEESFQEKWLNSSKYRTLFHLWENRPQGIPSIKLSPQRTRPLHNPVRRIAALSHILADDTLDRIPVMATAIWDQEHALCKKPRDWSALWKKLQNLLPHYSCEYWNNHYFFESEEQDQHLVLMGDPFKKEVITNVLLPLISKHLNHSTISYWNFYKNITSTETSKSNYLKYRFFGDSKKNEILKYTFASQGAFQMHSDFCQHYETSCIGCPFIERFKQKNRL